MADKINLHEFRAGISNDLKSEQEVYEETKKRIEKDEKRRNNKRENIANPLKILNKLCIIIKYN